jgi:hypothetical protein
VFLPIATCFRPNVWAPAILGVSLLLVVCTLLNFPLAGGRPLSLVLFTLGLSGESNVGAWWSGMLFLVAGLCALERAADPRRAAEERRGSAALAAALMLLSLDEVAWLHEWLTERSRLLLLCFGVVGLGIVAYSFRQLHRAHVPLHQFWLGFALLATVPMQKLITQGAMNAWVYGTVIALEECAELAGALVLLAATSHALRQAGASRLVPFVCVARFATPMLWLAAAALPLAAAATYTLNLTGAANWLGATLFLSCALQAMRAAQWGDPTAVAKAALYLVASVGAVAVRPDWDPVVSGHGVNIRGLYFGILLLGGACVVGSSNPWRRLLFLALAAVTLLSAFVLLRPQLVWSMWPPTVALLCFFMELTAAVRVRVGPPAASREQVGGLPAGFFEARLR